MLRAFLLMRAPCEHLEEDPIAMSVTDYQAHAFKVIKPRGNLSLINISQPKGQGVGAHNGWLRKPAPKVVTVNDQSPEERLFFEGQLRQGRACKHRVFYHTVWHVSTPSPSTLSALPKLHNEQAVMRLPGSLVPPRDTGTR